MTHTNGVVVTAKQLACEADNAWRTVCFYEHIQRKPSWFLRTILPVPLQTTGCYGKVGDTSRCLYSDGGYLTKRITQIDPGQRIAFEIVEQSIRYCRSIALCGGSIEVVSNGGGSCSVRMITHYEFLSRTVAFARVLVERTISSMHRIVLADMQARLEDESTPLHCKRPTTQHSLSTRLCQSSFDTLN